MRETDGERLEFESERGEDMSVDGDRINPLDWPIGDSDLAGVELGVSRLQPAFSHL